MKAVKHFKTITKHKILVGQLCFRVGLYQQGLSHDLSKYMPVEFMTGVHYYQGTFSPNSAERREKGYSEAWLHHKGRNKHHWEYWVDFSDQGVIAARMPYRYALEMFCDRVAASMVYQGKNYNDHHPLEYYELKHKAYFLHPETAALLEYLLHYLDQRGLDETIEMINRHHGYEDYLLSSQC